MDRKEEELKAWRIILDQLYPLEILPVLIACKDFNGIYSEEDWGRFLKDLFRLEESEILTLLSGKTEGATFRENYVIKSKERLERKLEIIKEIDNDFFPDLSWEGLSLTAKYHLFDECVQKIQKRSDDLQMKSLRTMSSYVEELIEKYPEMKEGLNRLTELAQAPNPGTGNRSKAIYEEFMKLLREDPSGKGLETLNKIRETDPSWCNIM